MIEDVIRLVRANIMSLEPYHSARETVQEGVLLDANESPYRRQWDGVDLNRYPDPKQARLRDALAGYLGVRPENVLAGVGSDEVLDWILKVFCQPGEDGIASMEPTYGMYRVTADIQGVSFSAFPLDSSFNFTASRFLEWVPDPVKVVFLCSPNNPTGNLLNRQEILRLCSEWPKIVVLDEAYVEFSGEPSLVNEMSEHPNLLVLRTLSKAFGSAGLRLGYVVAASPIIDQFMKVKSPYNLSSMAMEAGMHVVRHAQTELSSVEQTRHELKRVADGLGQIAGIEEIFPSQANFLLFRCPTARATCQKLLERGIVVRDRSSLAGLEDCIRVSIGTPAENDLFLTELKKIMERRL